MMDKEKVMVSKKLYDSVVNENIKLKIMLSECRKQIELLSEKKDLPIENQISISEYMKTLKPKGAERNE